MTRVALLATAATLGASMPHGPSAVGAFVAVLTVGAVAGGLRLARWNRHG